MSEKVCDDCGDKFFKFTMDFLDAWDLDDIIQPGGEYILCKGCIYKPLDEHYRKKVLDMKQVEK